MTDKPAPQCDDCGKSHYSWQHAPRKPAPQSPPRKRMTETGFCADCRTRPCECQSPPPSLREKIEAEIFAFYGGSKRTGRLAADAILRIIKESNK